MILKQVLATLALGALITGCCCDASAAEHTTKAGKVDVAVDATNVTIQINGVSDVTAIPEGIKVVGAGDVIVGDFNFDDKDDLAVKVGANGLNGVYLLFVYDQNKEKFLMAEKMEFASVRLNSESGGRRVYLTVAETDKVSNIVEYSWHNGKLVNVVSHKKTKE